MPSDTPGLASSGEANQAAANAARVRSAITGSFGSMLASQGANANTYADTLTHVVGPGQKLQGQAQAQGRVTKAKTDLTDLLKEKGAFRSQYESDARQSETKNVIAAQGLGLDVAQFKSDQDLARGVDPVTGKPLPKEKKPSPDTSALASNAAKYGYTLKQWRGMTPQQRQATIRKFGAKSKDGAGSPKSPQTQYANNFFKKYGVKPATTEQVNKARDSVQSAKGWLTRLRKLHPDQDLGHLGDLIAAGQAGDKDNDAIPKHDRVMVRAAMDLIQYGHISAGTADRLHKAGYSVKLLGLPARSKGDGVQIRKRQPSKGPITSGGDPAGRFK
jgi:hypothetical protein